ncbi:MAG: hypothetical protein AAFY88_05925, partial [Acidobacteriota bacterium]
MKAFSLRRSRGALPGFHLILATLALAWISTAALWAGDTQGAEISGHAGQTGAALGFGFSQCAVPSGAHPTLQDAIDDLSCTGADLASGDYQGPFRIERDFPITGPTDFSARLLGGLDVEGDAGVDVRLEYVQVQAGIDPSLIFADGFES